MLWTIQLPCIYQHARVLAAAQRSCISYETPLMYLWIRPEGNLKRSSTLNPYNKHGVVTQTHRVPGTNKKPHCALSCQLSSCFSDKFSGIYYDQLSSVPAIFRPSQILAKLTSSEPLAQSLVVPQHRPSPQSTPNRSTPKSRLPGVMQTADPLPLVPVTSSFTTRQYHRILVSRTSPSS